MGVSDVVLVDTGPLVAFLCEADAAHAWTIKNLEGVKPPLLCCECVLSEAYFLLERMNRPAQRIHGLLRDGYLTISFRLSEEWPSVISLMERYANIPMSLADASLVRMAEQHPQASILTLDSDFRIYRSSRGKALKVIAPAAH